MNLITLDELIDHAAEVFKLDIAWDVNGETFVAGEWLVGAEPRPVNYSICDLYRDCGGEYYVAPCGHRSIMEFESERERDEWIETMDERENLVEELRVNGVPEARCIEPDEITIVARKGAATLYAVNSSARFYVLSSSGTPAIYGEEQLLDALAALND